MNGSSSSSSIMDFISSSSLLLLLVSLMDFIAYASCTDEQRHYIMNSCSYFTGSFYATSSRSVAENIKQHQYPNIIASTGGPNTMVSLGSSTRRDSSSDTQQ